MGVFIDNATASDVYGYNAVLNTSTPAGATVNGTIYGGTQNGVGHGIIITHAGTEGRGAEFDITNPTNPDPAIISISQGDGNVVVAQNQNNTLTSTIIVGDFSYVGTDADDHVGVSGFSDPTLGLTDWGVGVQGYGGYIGAVGIQGSAAGWGVFSAGDFGASGLKAFNIDHPADPANKMLRHFSIESNEVLNMYRGTQVFNSNGKAIVELPEYYDLVNINPSYQLTAVGASMPNLYIEKEITNGQFVIAGGIEGKKVSWAITAERNDPYLQQNPQSKLVEVSKGERSGKYFMPELYGQPKEKSIVYKERKNYGAKQIKNSNIPSSMTNKPLSAEPTKDITVKTETSGSSFKKDNKPTIEMLALKKQILRKR